MAVASQAFQGLVQDERPAVQAGGRLLLQTPETFPEQRPYRDSGFVVLFVVTALGLAATAWQATQGFSFQDLSPAQREKIPMASIYVALLTSVAVSAALAMAVVQFTKLCTKLVVWGTLLFSPCLMLFLAIATPFLLPDPGSALITSLCLALPALLSIACVCCCWRSLVPFTIEVLHAVSTVMSENSGMVVVGAVGAVAMIAWTMLASSAFVGVWSQVQYMQNDSENALYFFLVLLMAWGGTVCVNTCHVTYCGIFGRWYFGKEPSVRKSLSVALTTSFGSICLGSLIIAAIQAASALLQKIRRDARENRDNAAIQCILCLLQCIVRCVEDIVETLSYFAYVQVAMRGFGFLDSARATFALCTWRNVSAIVACSLVDSVVGIGSLCCGVLAGLVACLAAAAVAPAGASHDDAAFASSASLALGAVLGTLVSGSVLQALRSGFATLCVGFAEDGQKLGAWHPNLHRAFQERAGLAGARM